MLSIGEYSTLQVSTYSVIFILVPCSLECLGFHLTCVYMYGTEEKSKRAIQFQRERERDAYMYGSGNDLYMYSWTAPWMSMSC
ncbi:unnamed protein product [Triticum turgidum subsp. durum]|uniref:Uncharacterized protein n=1 Tax=Triticum turgidum subsp. durum TaxID=4567 RepID=A0A9R0YQ72_TRITD|nr:unnamed protein product [Triticum turgidum subsp. durum]